MTELRPILLVDDDPADVELCLAAFASQNLANEVMVANGGEMALNLLRRQGEFEALPAGNPSLILLDLKMPKVDGFEVLRQIRSDEQLKMIPIVIMTTSHQGKDIVESYQLGVNAYVVKPVDFDQFMKAIKQVGLFWGVINVLSKIFSTGRPNPSMNIKFTNVLPTSSSGM